MASHNRHVLSRPDGDDADEIKRDIRQQIKFMRSDLLWVCNHPLRSPYEDEIRAWETRHKLPPGTIVTEVDRLPMVVGGTLVGPTILDMMTRTPMKVEKLPALALATLRAASPGGHAPEMVMVWQVREPNSLWPKAGQNTSATAQRELGENTKKLDHPFLAALASGGSTKKGGTADPDGWKSVQKETTVSIGEYCVKLAVGMCGGLSAAYRYISDIAAQAWADDIERALQIWRMIEDAPGGVLVEDALVRELRPASSISQQVERAVMRAACVWLEVDPDMNVSRPPGRPPGVTGVVEGDVLTITKVSDGTLIGRFKREFTDVAAGTLLSDLELLKLVELLGAFATDGLQKDAGLLEATEAGVRADYDVIETRIAI